MKLFSTLFLSLALITGAAQAHNNLSECELAGDFDLSVNCDCDYCDELDDLSTCSFNCDGKEHEAAQVSNIPSNPQERLEWGLKNLKIVAVVQALHADANPYELREENRSVNPYELLLRSINEPFSALNHPYEAETQEKMMNLLAATRKAHEIAAILITEGVSVDAQFPFFFDARVSTREIISDLLERNAHVEMAGSRFGKEYQYYALNLLKNLQTLIDKYQPEAQA